MENVRANSNIIIESRAKMSISGVVDVISFDETAVILDTELGGMIINGREFRINKLNVDVGELTIDGEIDGFSYQDVEKNKPGFFTKMFK
jgi:sporulation protein YabP